MSRPVDVVLLARNVIDEFEKQGVNIAAPLPVLGNGLVEVVSRLVRLPIAVHCLPWSAHHVRGRLNRYRDRADIIYSTSLNPCWSRFVICKEASHLLMGEDSYSSDPVSLVTNLINDLPPGIDKEVDAETSAVYGAMELLLPYKLRDELYNLEAQEKSHYDIAYHFRVPEQVVSLRLSPRTRAFVDRINDGLRIVSGT